MLPVFPLNAVLLPTEHMELRIFEPRYNALLEECLATEKPFIVAFCTDHDNEIGTLSDVGCAAEIVSTTPYEDGTQRVMVEGTERYRLYQMDDSGLYMQAQGEIINEVVDMDEADPVLDTTATLLEIYRELLADVDPSMLRHNLRLPLRIGDSFEAATHILLQESKKQALLEEASTRKRFDMVIKDLQIEIERMRFLLSDEDDQEVVN